MKTMCTVGYKKVSVVIPTFNRFEYLLNAIASVQSQTYKNIEIIIVNDGSTDKQYYTHDFKGCTIVHLKTNTKQMFGYACTAYVRNQGIQAATGDFIAFLDDDDIWFPNKLQLQIEQMMKSKCEMSSTDGLIGHGVYDAKTAYKKYNKEEFFSALCGIYKTAKKSQYLNAKIGFPQVWTFGFLQVHNCCVTSSVVVSAQVLKAIGGFKIMPNQGEDYECWLRALKKTNCVYLEDVCFYYDADHGKGREY